MHALVTGSNGLLGNHIVRALLQEGHTVRAMVRKTSNKRALDGLDIELVYGDVRNPEDLRAAADGCDTIFHTAAVFAYWNFSEEEMNQTAREGARNVVDAAKDAGVKRLILTSSAAVLGRNTSIHPMTEETEPHLQDTPAYFRSKALQEEIAVEHARERGVELISVNPSVIIGPNDFKPSASMATVTGYLLDPLKLTYPGGVNIVHVEDAARGHLLLAERGTPGERYLVSADNWEWQRVHETISDLCRIGGPRITMGRKGAMLGTALMELGAKLTKKPPLGTRDQARLVGSYFWYNHSKAAALGYRARSTRDALVDTIAWLLDSSHLSAEQKAQIRPSMDVETARKRLAGSPATAA